MKKYEKGDLIRCRYKVLTEQFINQVKIGIGIVMWHEKDYCKVILSNSLQILSHVDDMELMSKGNLVK